MSSVKKTIEALDNTTLKTLIKEAKKIQKEAEREFERSDDADSMNAAEAWDGVVSWLERWLEAKNDL